MIKSIHYIFSIIFLSQFVIYYEPDIFNDFKIIFVFTKYISTTRLHTEFYTYPNCLKFNIFNSLLACLEACEVRQIQNIEFLYLFIRFYYYCKSMVTIIIFYTKIE